MKRCFKMVRKVRRYTKEFRDEAINLALKSPSISSTAIELGIPAGTLHTWIENLKDSSASPSHKTPDKPNMSALIEENRRLNKELARVREEKEILKKAAAYFAQHLK
jgi:transposase